MWYLFLFSLVVVKQSSNESITIVSAVQFVDMVV